LAPDAFTRYYMLIHAPAPDSAPLLINICASIHIFYTAFFRNISRQTLLSQVRMQRVWNICWQGRSLASSESSNWHRQI